MLRLKELNILESRVSLNTLPGGKLLINTINAHSYNTALKDAAFAEALIKRRCTDSRWCKHRDGVPLAEGKIPT